MTPRSIQYVLRNLADTGPPVSDAELLRRYLADDEPAFAELVRRHGRLVWAVCRQLTRSDAEADDAFQATFLVLLKNAGKVREAAKLSAWLHGVAYKVCAKSRQAAQRRSNRERSTAVREGNGSAVPDSAWDLALAAVHAEVAKLPETLRVPFVLCCLEGVGVTEAAERLGWKLGTLSGRLTRAKDAVLAKLEARGLTLGIVASVGVVSVPAAVVAKAEALAQVGFAVPSSIVQLSQGVLGMSLKSVKVLAAAVMLTCGLGWSLGTSWMANADAQEAKPTASPPPLATPQDEVKRLKAELELAQKVADEQSQRADLKAWFAQVGEKVKEIPSAQTAKYEYDLVAVYDLSQTKFREFLQERESRGWDYCGSTPLAEPKQVIWVFRRPVKAVGQTVPPAKALNLFRSQSMNGTLDSHATTKLEDVKSIEAEIAKLQAKLAAIKQSTALTMVVISYAGQIDGAALKKLMVDLGEKKFGKGSIQVVDERVAKSVMVSGTKEVTDWAVAWVKKIQETER